MAKYQLSFVGVFMTFPIALKIHLDRSDLGKGGLLWFTGQGIHTVCLAGSQAGESLKQPGHLASSQGCWIINTSAYFAFSFMHSSGC